MHICTMCMYSREISPAFIKRNRPNDRTRNSRLRLELFRLPALFFFFTIQDAIRESIKIKVYYTVSDLRSRRKLGCFIRDKILHSYIFNPNRIFVL